MDKTIDIDLPPHTPQLVVECYLEQGKPFRATVLETSSYFDAPTPPLVPDAEVHISYNGQRVKLQYNPTFNEKQSKGFTHSSNKIMRGQPGDVYSIEVTDGKGRKVTGYTTVLPKVPIDSVKWQFNENDKALLLTYFKDNPNTANYYRYMTHRDSVRNGSNREFTLTDNLNNGKQIVIGSNYNYESGDTVVVSLFHLEKKYYDFLRSADDAEDANGNPFAQPSRVISTVEGGIGVFTNLVYDRRTVIIAR
ncbi:DUF4249 domain-containing protein [Pontibacter sp. XAAS-A31]|nr:DUF4249 domain-containing protein [Pontibacter harenae]